MEWLILVFILISILLFGLSFFAKDKQKEMKEELDHLSLQVMGDLYQVKKRLRVVEEEMLTVSDPPTSSTRPQANDELVKEAYQLFQQNNSIEETAETMELKKDEVKYLLAQLN
ncbi:hypothetical protein, partial [Salibacterium aidingense]|uniref:hypothetical protein n=1 Tax=Salibacterium aidingense TaxID=384933 RepID=UPI00041BCD97